MVEQRTETGYKHTEIGVIPEDWDAKELGEIATIVSGGTPRTNVKRYWDGNIPWCTPTDITRTKGKYISDTERKISKIGLDASSAVLLPIGSLLLCSRATIGEVRIAKSEICTNQGFKSILCKEPYRNEYVYYQLLTSKGDLIAKASGTTFLEISKTEVARVRIPVPPTFHEQLEIANVLSDIDNLIERYDDLIDKKNKIKQGTMRALLTAERRLAGFHEKWGSKSYGQIFRVLNSASKPWADLSTYGGVGYIHYGDIHKATSPFLDCNTMQLPRIDQSKVSDMPRVKSGDLVMVNASEDYAGIGKSVEIRNAEGNEVVAGLHTFLLRGDDEHLANGFKGYMQFIPQVKAALISLSTGISVYGTSKTSLMDIEVLLPDVDEQSAIAEVLSDMDAEIEDFVRQRGKYVMIRQGMMEQLLAGRIRLQ